MPGIHVRSFGKLDWVERGNEPNLTIPGAYWLCHKKHIYKFTFKWHKTLRNTEGFDYPKELTKVIRRIIKSQPRQGQQFGTRHLLVTYNHSPWMRQDKMFAMLKFRDRTDATAFPHAFVLTVKTLNVSTSDELCSADKREDCDNTSSEVAKNTRLQGTNDGNENTDQDDSQNHCSRGLGTKDDVEDFDKISSSDKPFDRSSTDARKPETERKKDPGKKTTKRPKSFDNMESSPPVKRYNRRGQPISDKMKHKDLPDSPATKGITSESADLPYQYIIEKEIEDSKGVPDEDCLTADEAESCPGPGHGQSQSSLPGKLLPRSPRAAQTDTPRSADITDLVMEGLMFTIRQDQDSITVVEQKTKLEMDEVLENSEKAETKEGEKCLLNSSLLRLENLITKIDMPENRPKNNNDIPKSPPAAIGSNGNVEKPFLYSTSGSSTNFDRSPWKYGTSSPHSRSLQSPIFEMPKFPLVKINLNNIRDVLNDKLSFDHDIKGRETNDAKDVAMDIDQDIRESRKDDEIIGREMEDEEEDEVGLELKYDDKDDLEADTVEKEDYEGGREEEIVSETLQQRSHQDPQIDNVNTTNRSVSDLDTTPIKDCTEIVKSNTPRIVSNEILTDDQIPPELQRALRYKRTKRLFFNNEIDTNVASNTATMSTHESATSDTDLSQMELPIVPTVERVISENELTDKSEIANPSTTTIDITAEFEEELSSEKRRKQPVRRTSLRNAEETSSITNQTEEKPKIRIEMWKFMQDITRGAKVVVRRLDLTNIPNSVVTESSLSKYNINQRYATES